MSIIDKRSYSTSASSSNRKRFIERCKKGLKDSVEEAVRNSRLKDLKSGRAVYSKDGSLDEPSVSNDGSTGKPSIVVANNRLKQRGDSWIERKSGGEGAGSGGGGDGEDTLKEYKIILTKEEFMDLVFEGMELPNCIKESLTGSDKYKLKRAGTAPDGPSSRLNIQKTFEAALGRKFATRDYLANQDPARKPPYLTDEDLRYNLYDPDPLPIHKAVLFVLRDDSGSMGEEERALAKRFFWLLYLFLEREYEEIEIRYFLYSERFEEVKEYVFFHRYGGGGTAQTGVIQALDQIITEEYDLTKVNIYLAQVSDGGDFGDEEILFKTTESILGKLQYMAYLEVGHQWNGQSTVMSAYERLKVRFTEKLNMARTNSIAEIFPILRNLFSKKVGEK